MSLIAPQQIHETTPATANVRDEAHGTSWLAASLMLCWALFIFWRLPGATQYDPDDFSITHCLPNIPLPHDLTTYVGFVGGRDYNLFYLQSLYNLAHHNTDILTLAGVAVFIGSSILLFTVLKRIYSTPAALVGAMLFLAHPMKWHAVLVFNAQGYIPILLEAVILFGILTSRITRGWQCALVTIVYWFSLHQYEHLLLMTPIFALFWLGPSLAKKRMPRISDVIYSLVPLAVTALHINLLSLAPSPLWNRNVGHDPAYFSKAPQAIGQLFLNGASQLYGLEHFALLKMFVGNFFRYDAKTDHTLWFALLTCLAVTFLYVRNVFAAEEPQLEANQNQVETAKLTIDESNQEPADAGDPDRQFKQKALLISGAFLTLVGPLLAIPCSLEVVHSRLLFVPSLGLAITAAGALDLLIPRKFYKPAFAFLITVCVLEAIAFSNVVRQLITAADVDKKVACALRAILPAPLQKGDHVFISYPFNERRLTYWNVEPPVLYHNAGPARLWNTFDSGFDSLTYSSVMRYPHMENCWGLHTWITGTAKTVDESKMYPFYMQDDGQLVAITAVTLMDARGARQRIVHSAMGPMHLNGKTETLAVTPDTATQALLWNMNCPMPTELTHPDASSLLILP